MSRWRDSGLKNFRLMLPRKSTCSQLVALLSLSVWSCVGAAAPNPLHTTLIPELRIADTQSQEKRFRMVPATIIEQGAEVFYTVRATNESNEKLRNAAIVQAVPANTRFIERSATGAGAIITYSVDGGRNFISANDLRGLINDTPRNVRVTHIRWQFRHALAPHVTVLARFRVVFG